MAEKQDYPSIAGIGQWKSMETEGKDVKKKTNEYSEYFDRSKGEEALAARKRDYTTVVNHYYDLVTDFYEYGWGQSFHFARRRCDQTFNESIITHERLLADKLLLKKGDKVLDVGCGVGGPMREISRYSGASIVGINNNDYQLQRLALHNERAGLAQVCSGVKGDFLHMPFENTTFDHAFSVEATCHAPDRVQVYSEVFRSLKPGGRFAIYEWCMTDLYDPKNAQHNEIKHGIEVGDGLPPILTTHEVLECVRKAGFNVSFSQDMADNGPGMIPWYATLAGSWSLSGFRMTWLGRSLTHNLCRAMEFLRVAPEGTVAASQLLMDAADNLVAGGQTGIFTPMFLVIAEKPL